MSPYAVVGILSSSAALLAVAVSVGRWIGRVDAHLQDQDAHLADQDEKLDALREDVRRLWGDRRG